MSFDFEALRQVFQSLESRLAGVRSRRTGIRNEILELQKKREAINYAPGSREDVKSHLAKWVHTAGAEHTARFIESTEQFARTIRTASSNQLRALATLKGDEFSSPGQTGPAICAFMGPILIEAMNATVDAMPWPANAIPTAGRDKLIAELDERIGKLQAEEAELITKAQEAGINLE